MQRVQAVSASKTVKGQLEEFLRDAQERGNVYIVLPGAWDKSNNAPLPKGPAI